MSLVDKIQASGETSERISGHAFKDILTLWLIGDYIDAERNPMLQSAYPGVTFTAQIGNQLDEVKTHFDNLPNLNAKQNFIITLEPAMSELRSGRIDGARWKSIMGITS